MKTAAAHGSSVTLRQALQYQPVELEFGTSGLRGLVKDITDLEAYVATRAFLQFLREAGDARAGGNVFIAGDLRPSTGTIMVPVCRAAADAGFSAVLLGRIPSPALLLYAIKRGCPSVMVTGSHIPFDRNGIKLNRKGGEVRKADEQPIRAAQKRLREAEYGRPLAKSMFDERGALRAAFRSALPAEVPEAASEYLRRYAEAFPRGALNGKRVLVYQHSAVGRDLLVQALENLGAIVVSAGRSETFVPVDTEAVNEEMLRQIQDLVDANGGAPLDAVVSTDGDSDRPLVLGVDGGKVSFYPGDILGIVTADFVGAREIAVPISVNDAVDAHFARRGIKAVKTRIGSPYVIDAMKQVGWEANGGFLTAAPVAVPGGGTLDALPTRDALLPILSALCASLGRGETLTALFSRLPPRFGKSGLLRDFPRDKALKIMRRFSVADPSVFEARRGPSGQWSVLRADSTADNLGESDPLARSLLEICGDLSAFFTPGDGFGDVTWINWQDGVRVGFESGDVAHIRPSGNAPELRMYANAGTPRRAEAIVRLGTSNSGILRRLAAAVDERQAIDLFRAAPRAVLLECPVQHYAWGGYDFIPSLLGERNPGRIPCAELWIGAHPLAPSSAAVDGAKVRLDRLLSGAPEALGDRDAARFRGKLPFLMKVLDARIMLSIQAHPSREQAATGFGRENAAGVPLQAPERFYKDDNHKPEAHVALTEFWMLHGFRPLEEIGMILEGIPELGAAMPDFTTRLRSAGRQPEERERLLRELYSAVMTMAQDRVDDLLSPLLSRLTARDGTRTMDKDTPDFWAMRAARELPLPGGHRDRGIFSIYLLNLLHLHPGQGTYQPAGTLHAYLEGTNIEVMASSDNVLRGGLTPKSVEVGELLRTVSYADGRPPVLTGREISPGVRAYETAAEEFVLDRIDLAANAPLRVGAEHGVECFITVEGSARLGCARRELTMDRGTAAMVPAGTPYDVRATAAGALLFRSRIPGA
ncbi:MAG: mannose-6-phosphate isomerase, class I [Spirochaetia bacterium]